MSSSSMKVATLTAISVHHLRSILRSSVLSFVRAASMFATSHGALRDVTHAYGWYGQIGGLGGTIQSGHLVRRHYQVALRQSQGALRMSVDLSDMPRPLPALLTEVKMAA